MDRVIYLEAGTCVVDGRKFGYTRVGVASSHFLRIND